MDDLTGRAKCLQQDHHDSDKKTKYEPKLSLLSRIGIYKCVNLRFCFGICLDYILALKQNANILIFFFIRFHPSQDLVLTSSGDGAAHIWRAQLSQIPDIPKSQSSGDEEVDVNTHLF